MKSRFAIATLVLIIMIILCGCVAAEAQVTVPQDAPVATSQVALKGLHAVALIETPDTASAYLEGSATIDARSVGSIKTKWYQVSGPKSVIEQPDSLGTRVFSMPVGVFKYGFVVLDTRSNLADTAYKTVSVTK